MEFLSFVLLGLLAANGCLAQKSTLKEITDKMMNDVRNAQNDVIKTRVGMDAEKHQGTKLTDIGSTLDLVLNRMADLEAENREMREEMAELKRSVADLEHENKQLNTREVPSAFLATVDATQFTPSDPCVFNVTLFDVGGHYNPSTGVYTVPLDGVYEFVFQYVTFESSPSAWLVVDGQNVAYTTGSTSNNLVVVQRLTAGQEVWVRPDNMPLLEGSDGAGIPAVWFSGHLIQ